MASLVELVVPGQANGRVNGPFKPSTMRVRNRRGCSGTVWPSGQLP